MYCGVFGWRRLPTRSAPCRWYLPNGRGPLPRRRHCPNGRCVDGQCFVNQCTDGEERACDNGCGGTQVCSGGGLASLPQAVTEICGDGRDNDCDMQIDEQCQGCSDGTTRDCMTECGVGSEICAGNQWRFCDAPRVHPEVCVATRKTMTATTWSTKHVTIAQTARPVRAAMSIALGLKRVRTIHSVVVRRSHQSTNCVTRPIMTATGRSMKKRSEHAITRAAVASRPVWTAHGLVVLPQRHAPAPMQLASTPRYAVAADCGSENV